MFIFACLLATNAIFAAPAQQEETRLIAKEETAPLFQRYLATCRTHNKRNQPVHLRNGSPEKVPSYSEMTLLDLEVPSTMSIHAVAERVLYGDADVVHLTNTSTENASQLYEMLQYTYTHFIHVPDGLFIASKYPLSQATVTLEELDFVIHGTNPCPVRVSQNDLSMQIASDTADYTVTPVLFMDVPGALTVVEQPFSSSQLAQNIDLLAEETFHILPIRRDSRDRDEGGGYSVEGHIGRSWGGPDGGKWEGSVKGEVHDGHGNYVEGEVKQNDRGEGSVSARAGHEEK